MNTTSAQLEFPAPEDGDSEQVALYLETGHALWVTGDAPEAARWLRRAVEAAEEEGNDMRSLNLARAAADIRGAIGASAPPPLPTAPSPVAEARDRSQSGVAPVPPPLPEMPSAQLPGTALRSRPPPKPPSIKPPPSAEPSAVTTPMPRAPVPSRPPLPPSARASMPPAPSARASMTPQPPSATPVERPLPSAPAPSAPSMPSSPSARTSMRPAPSNRTSVAPSKPASIRPPAKPASSAPRSVVSGGDAAAPRAHAALDDMTTSAQLQSLLASGRAVRVSVKRSARDDGLYVVRKIAVGRALPVGAREAILVLPEVDPEF